MKKEEKTRIILQGVDNLEPEVLKEKVGSFADYLGIVKYDIGYGNDETYVDFYMRDCVDKFNFVSLALAKQEVADYLGIENIEVVREMSGPDDNTKAYVRNAQGGREPIKTVKARIKGPGEI